MPYHKCYNYSVFALIYVYMYVRSSTGQTAGPIFVVDGSNDAVWRKEVPFGGRIDQNSYFAGQIPPKHPKKSRGIGNPSQN